MSAEPTPAEPANPGGGSAQSGDSAAQPMLSQDSAKAAIAMAQRKLASFDTKWWIFFFVAAGCVVAAGVISVIDLTFTLLQPFDLISSIYLLLFGLMMLMVDFPVKHHRVQQFKALMFKYFLFMTRFTGRGVWYLFLGCMTFATLWNNSISGLLAFILGGYVSAVGIACLYFGIMKSYKLNRLREALRSREGVQGDAGDFCPQNGMTATQFQQLAEGMKHKFSDEEIEYVFNAISPSSDGSRLISKDDFRFWCSPGPMLIL